MLVRLGADPTHKLKKCLFEQRPDRIRRDPATLHADTWQEEYVEQKFSSGSMSCEIDINSPALRAANFVVKKNGQIK
jgi:hypothetical protein